MRRKRKITHSYPQSLGFLTMDPVRFVLIGFFPFLYDAIQLLLHEGHQGERHGHAQVIVRLESGYKLARSKNQARANLQSLAKTTETGGCIVFPLVFSEWGCLQTGSQRSRHRRRQTATHGSAAFSAACARACVQSQDELHDFTCPKEVKLERVKLRRNLCHNLIGQHVELLFIKVLRFRRQADGRNRLRVRLRELHLHLARDCNQGARMTSISQSSSWHVIF